jgi:hypothetical protein
LPARFAAPDAFFFETGTTLGAEKPAGRRFKRLELGAE